jgi:hypothetical protein
LLRDLPAISLFMVASIIALVALSRAVSWPTHLLTLHARFNLLYLNLKILKEVAGPSFGSFAESKLGFN